MRCLMISTPRNEGDLEKASCCSQVPKLFSKMPWRTWWFRYFLYYRDTTFLVVCIVAVAADPLFFYLPVIQEAVQIKCISIDKTLKIIAICVRSFLDLVALGDLLAMRKLNKCPHKQINDIVNCAQEEKYTTWPQRLKRSDYVINILSILPVPQVLMPTKYYVMSFGNFGNFLNAVVLLQYVPRLVRIYRLLKIVNENIILPKSLPIHKFGHVDMNNPKSYKNKIPTRGFILMKAGFNLFLYLLASHAVGAFWYFFSIERETTCWQLACDEHDIECRGRTISLSCRSYGQVLPNYTALNEVPVFPNYTALNEVCSIEKPNTTLFDFGIFQYARQSGILASMNLLEKLMFCFWWGLRNLSTLGEDLKTSTNFLENCFTVLISIFGLLLFLYFIGNLQAYMQRDAINELEDIKSKLPEFIPGAKLKRVDRWIKKWGLPEELKKEIKRYVERELKVQNNDIDTKNPFPHLPTELKTSIEPYLGLPLLRKVPKFKDESEELLSWVAIKYLKRVKYKQNSFIVREGKPLKKIIFVVKGYMCTCTSDDHGDTTESCADKCDLIGVQALVEWVMASPRQSNPPTSKRTLKCHTNVEALRLKARDLKDIYNEPYGSKLVEIYKKIQKNPTVELEQLKHDFAASSIHPK